MAYLQQVLLLQIRPRSPCSTTGNSESAFGEVRFFFRFHVLGVDRTLALVSLYSDIDRALFEQSYKTLAVYTYRGNDGLAVIDAKDIASVVSMQPLPMTAEEARTADAKARYGNRWFVCEKPGLDIAKFVSVVAQDGVDE